MTTFGFTHSPDRPEPARRPRAGRTMISMALAATAALLGPSGCDDPDSTIPDGASVYVWLSAMSDTYARCGMPSGCTSDYNHAGEGEIRVSNWPDNEYALAYIDFPRVELPPGWKVEEAYLELFNGGTMGDGTSDDRCLQVGRIIQPWDPREVTWQNQPYQQGLGASDARFAMRSMGWGATGDIRGLVEMALANPASNHGFVIAPGANVGNQPLKKAFYSLNHPTRNADLLGKAPRLLLRLSAPSGAKLRDLDAGSGPPHDRHELRSLGNRVVVAEVMDGGEWPAEWDVQGPKKEKVCQ